MPVAVASDLALALDPVLLAERLGLEPDPWQSEALRSPARRQILLCGRQTGKSTVSSVKAAHTAVYEPGSLVLLLSPSLRQSQELFRKVLNAHRALGETVPTEAMSALRLELRNGSRIISMPGNEMTVRGYTASLLIVDEAARVSDGLYAAVRPMLAVSGGRLMLLSTPFGTRGFFYEAWRSDQVWERHRVPSTECPRIAPEFLAEERETLGDWFYRQEYEVEFMDAQTQAFSRADIERMLDPEVKPWDLSSWAST